MAKTTMEWRAKAYPYPISSPKKSPNQATHPIIFPFILFRSTPLLNSILSSRKAEVAFLNQVTQIFTLIFIFGTLTVVSRFSAFFICYSAFERGFFYSSINSILPSIGEQLFDL